MSMLAIFYFCWRDRCLSTSILSRACSRRCQRRSDWKRSLAILKPFCRGCGERRRRAGISFPAETRLPCLQPRRESITPSRPQSTFSSPRDISQFNNRCGRYNPHKAFLLGVPTMSVVRTLGELRRSPFSEQRLTSRRVKDELRENLMSRLRGGSPVFPGFIGYDDTVVPQIVNAILSRHNFILLGLRGQ